MGAAYERMGPVARRWLPAPIKRRLGRFVSAFETSIAASPRTQPDENARLRAFAPLFPAASFAAGPVLLVNNALAWGGAERQVVNTMTGLASRLDRPVKLICQKLHDGADYDFYLPALSQLASAVRNMMPFAEATAALEQTLPEPERARVTATIAWLPSDVRERIWQLVAEFAALRPPVVHAWQDALSIEAGFAAKIAGVPRIVVSARNLAPINFAYHRPYMQTAYRELAACADVIMLNNSNEGARSYAAWLEIEPGRIQVLRNGFAFDAALRDRAALRAELGIPAGAPVVGSIFRFYDEKRPLLWVETAAHVLERLPDTHFVVYGVGPLMEKARDRARSFAGRLHTPGASPDAAQRLAMFDAFLLTSEFEGTPNVVLEASAAGIPVVIAPAGGAAEAVEEGVTGFVVEPPTPEALAERIAFALTDAGFRARCADEAPRFVETRFGLNRMLDETLAIYGLAR